MVNRIDLPQQPQGSAEEQMRAMYSYLYQMAQALNNNLAEIGGAELTDRERTAMQEVLSAGAEEQAGAATEAETLKSLIIKTASFIKTAIDQYNLKLTGSTEAEGKIGKYVRNTQLDVDVTPTGIQQSFSFQEIIQGLKQYEINAKNYIKSGLLRTVNGVPVYGVAIGKDVVTFAEDGTETYNDGNKVAELTADELSFWQSGNKIASYTGSKISFLYSGSEVMYIQNGKIYCTQDMEMSSGKSIKIQNWKFTNEGMTFDNGSDSLPFQLARYDDAEALSSGIFTDYETGSGKCIIRAGCDDNAHQSTSGYWLGEITEEVIDEADETFILPGVAYTPNLSYTIQGNRNRLYPSGNIECDLGKTDSHYIKIYGHIFYGKKSYQSSAVETNDIILSPREDLDGFFRITMEKRTSGFKRMYAEFIGTEDTNYYTTSFMGINEIYGRRRRTTDNSSTLTSRTIKIYPMGFANMGFIFAYYELRDNGYYKVELNPTFGAFPLDDPRYTLEVESDGLNRWEMKNMKSFSGNSGTFTNLTYTNLTQNSSRDIKHDIEDMETVGEKLDRLRPVTFVYDDDPEEKRRAGLIYEETAEVLPEICTGEESAKAISYVEMIPMLLKEIQELRARVKALEEREGGN
jgi:hypothetical protein